MNFSYREYLFFGCFDTLKQSETSKSCVCKHHYDKNHSFRFSHSIIEQFCEQHKATKDQAHHNDKSRKSVADEICIHNISKNPRNPMDNGDEYKF